MANYWLVKTEPSTYSYDDLEREHTAVWDGVKNPVALRNLRAMHPGDCAARCIPVIKSWSTIPATKRR